MLLLDKVGTIMEINEAFTNFFGFTQNDIIGKNFSILFTETDRQAGVPQREIETVLLSGQASDNNFLVGKDKNLTWVSGESILVENPDGTGSILKVIQNINAQKTSENSIIRLSNFNESILRAIEDVVMVLNKDLNIIQVNDAFSKLFGNTWAATKKVNFADLVQSHGLISDLYDKVREVINTKESFFNYVLEVLTNVGEKRYLTFPAAFWNIPAYLIMRY